MEQLRIGIIGFGRIGAEHARWLAACGVAIPVAVADPTPARRAIAESRGLATVESHEALLARKDIDAVLITTPTSMHFEHAGAALHAGKHVMVDKPVTLDLEQARQLATAAKRQAVVLSVFQNRRWDIDYLTVQRAVQAGTFGKVINVESRLGQWASCIGPAAKEYRPGWRNEAGFGGGGLYDWGSHFIDQLWRLMLPAKPQSVFAQLRGNVWTNDCDDFARLCINFDSGAVGMVEINTTTTATLPRWHIDGSTGSAESPFSPGFDTAEWARLMFTPARALTTKQPIPLAPAGLSEIDIWQRFTQACRTQTAPAVTIDSVLPTMALLDAARESSRTGQAAALTPEIDWTKD